MLNLKSECCCFFSLKPASTVFPPNCRSNSRFGVKKGLWQSRSTLTFSNMAEKFSAEHPSLGLGKKAKNSPLHCGSKLVCPPLGPLCFLYHKSSIRVFIYHVFSSIDSLCPRDLFWDTLKHRVN
jgi:hypothetical protein